MAATSNFAFLEEHPLLLLQLAQSAERAFAGDPNIALIKLRQFGEAMGIVAHIRRAALGEALVPFEQRVNVALQKIQSLHAWTTPQRQWLDRLGQQLVFETVLDTDYLNRNFPDAGGANGLDKRLGGHLDQVMTELSERLWDAV